jgi:L-ascorbate metabolism protein UlaG (beta-lactamase superfamily)
MVAMETTLIASMTLVVAAQYAAAGAEADFEIDRIPTAEGAITITFIGHGTLALEFAGKVIHVDPWTRLADYAKLPKADVVLITHEHRDHLDLDALQAVRTEDTEVIVSKSCEGKVENAKVMENGDRLTVAGIDVEAVPAYNLVHKRSSGEPYHPEGNGNGYVLTLGDKRVYIAGDTENVPEMRALENIDVAFLPMNLPYTMTPEMVADAAKAFRPAILYPYHFGDTDTSELARLLEDEEGIEVRIRKME